MSPNSPMDWVNIRDVPRSQLILWVERIEGALAKNPELSTKDKLPGTPFTIGEIVQEALRRISAE